MIPRREFLKSSAVTTAAAFGVPRFVGATDKAGAKPATVGEGEHVYECHHDWGLAALPDGYTYGTGRNGQWQGVSHGVAVDEQGLIYISHHGNPGSIFVFDADGGFVRAMGDLHNIMDKAAGVSRAYGHGIDIRKEGSEEFIYLAPNVTSLFFAKLTLKGELVWKRDRADLHKDSGVYTSNQVRYRPTNTSFRPDGGYYLGDGYGSNYLFQYDANDKFVRAIGGSGQQDGQFRTPHGQWLDDRDGTPKLVVADRANARLQWFDMEGKHLRTVDGFLFPADIDVRGKLMLVPDLYGRVTLVDERLEMVAQLGDDPQWRSKVTDKKLNLRSKREQWPAGRFVHPHDACFDHDGNIFVAEWVVGGRVSKLVKVG